MEWINGPEILAGIAIIMIVLYAVWMLTHGEKCCICKKRGRRLNPEQICLKCDKQMAKDLYEWEKGVETREYYEYIHRTSIGDPTPEEIARYRANWDAIGR